MAVTAKGGIYTTPYKGEIPMRPGDMVLEVLRETAAASAISLTMLTDTAKIGWASFVAPVNRTADPGEVSVSALGKTVTINTEADEAHDVFVFGGYGAYEPRPPAFAFRSYYEPHRADGIVWEMVRGTMSSGSLKVTAATDLQTIDFPLFIIPTEVKAAAPDVNGAGVTELTSIDFTLECGAGTAVVQALVGGLSRGATPTDITPNVLTYTDKPILLANAKYRRPADLVGEIITKTLDGQSPATVTITAASDCSIVRHIEMIIPISKKTSGLAVSWDGGTGKTSAIYSANGDSNDVTCLVLGR